MFIHLILRKESLNQYPPIATKRTTTSHLNTQKNHDIWRWQCRS